MIDVLDYGFAWLAVILTLVLAVVYITRKIVQSHPHSNSIAALINRNLRKPHKTLGVLLIMAGLVHGLASSEIVWSFNYGTICWIISILFGINWLFRDQLKFIGGWLIYHRIITVVFLFSIVWHIVDIGGVRVFGIIANSNRTNTALVEEYTQKNEKELSSSDDSSSTYSSDAGSSPAAMTTEQKPQQSYDASSDFQFDGVTLKDGTYTGSADGYGPGLTVKVTVKNGKVESIEIVSHNENNSRYYTAPMQIIPDEILQNQSVDVDIVSGATFTSVGIKNAVIDALSNAVISGQLPQAQALPNIRRH